MGSNYCYFNDKIELEDNLLFKDFHRLRYGDSLFESMLYINDGLPLLKYHIERLLHSCKYLQLDFPEIDIIKIVHALVEKNDLKGNVRVRLTVFRNDGKLYSPDGNESSVLIEVEKYSKEIFKPIKTIGVYSENKKPLNIYSLLKSGNALHYVIAKQYAKTNGFDEVLLMNPNSEIIEAASNNIFYIHDGKIYTPPTSTGCVNGVFKKYLSTEIIDKTTYAACLVDDLIQFDEIFLTNAVGMIIPVKGYKDKRYSSEITNQIIDKVKRKLSI